MIENKNQILLVFILLIFSVADGETLKLEFKPSNNDLYYYDFTGGTTSGWAIKNVKSPLIFASQKTDLESINFLNIIDYVTEVPPPDDIAKLIEIQMSTKGNVDYWEKKYSKNDIFSVQQLSEKIIVFPYLTKEEYKVGEEWLIKVPVPIVFRNEIDSSNHVSDHLANVKQKITNLTSILGYECAEIQYSFTDTVIIESKRLKFKCRGKVFFALKEGIVISDMMDIEQEHLSYGKYYDYKTNNMLWGKIVFVSHYVKNLRLVKQL